MVLPPEEAHHVVAVLRAVEGQQVELFDGRGGEANGTLERIEGRSAVVRVERLRTAAFELPCRFTVAVAPPRQHRASYLIEKCTELGAAAFWPMRAARSTVKPQATVCQRWARRAVEAAKQARRTWVPEVAEPQDLHTVLGRSAEFDATIMLHAHDQAASLQDWMRDQPQTHTVLILIGPEGGWTEEEVAAATRAGFALLRLTPTVLRTETCAVAACAAFALWAQRPTDNQRNEVRS